jgi:MFS family permease
LPKLALRGCIKTSLTPSVERRQSMAHHRKVWPRIFSPLTLVYLLIFSAQCSRTMFIVIISWFALSLTGDFASVGRVLVWWPLLSLLVGPIIGVVVDRFNRSGLVVIGESIRTVALTWLVLAVDLDSAGAIGMVSLYAVSFIAYCGALLTMPSTQGLLQAVGGRSHPRIVIGAVSVGLAAEILGAAAGGLAVAWLGIAGSFVICIVLSVVAAALAIPLRAQGSVPLGANRRYSMAITDAFWIICRDRQLLMTCLTLILGWAAAQMTLALLAAFTRFELRLGSDAYGWIDAMWGVGGIAGGIALIWLSRQSVDRYLLRFSLLFLAAAIAAFSLAQGFWTALLLHGLMGAAFAVSLALCDTHILKVVDAGAIGRVRNNLQAAIGAVGVVIFLLPSLYSDLSVRSVYLGFALVLAGAAAALLIGHYRSESPAKTGLPSPDTF